MLRGAQRVYCPNGDWEYTCPKDEIIDTGFFAPLPKCKCGTQIIPDLESVVTLA